MASIRIVDVWLRSPVSQPTAWRSVMVIADAWAEQRVLMRAYAASADQTRPTIVLHGVELAIGPASADANGSWGIHVEPPLDGRAQELREQLQLAAKRMAGSKGTPPRLEDEQPAFERKRTNNWMPGAPRDPAEQQQAGQAPYYEPAVAASQAHLPPTPPYQPQGQALAHMQQQAYVPPPVPTAAYAPPPSYPPPQSNTPAYASPYAPPSAPPYPPPVAISPGAATVVPHLMNPPVVAGHGSSPVPHALSVTPMPSPYPDQRLTPIRVSGGAAAATTPTSSHPHPHPSSASSGSMAAPRRGWTSPVRPAGPEVDRPVGATTAMGFTSGSGAQSPAMRLGLTPAEREVLNALGEAQQLTAQRIRALVGAEDPVAWMEQLIQKLAAQGLELVAPGQPQGGEPTYVLRR